MFGKLKSFIDSIAVGDLRAREDLQDLEDIALAARAMNGWIRRNVDEGYLRKMSSSQHEVAQLHKMRKLLAKHFNEPIESYEPSVYILKKAIAGDSL